MAVGADQGLARHAEALQMHLMADAVARAGKPDPVLFRHRLDVAVVVGVFKARLEGVVVDIGHGALRLYPVQTHGLKFQIGHSAGGVLGQGLVDPQGGLLTGDHAAAHQVGRDNFFNNIPSHCLISPCS